MRTSKQGIGAVTHVALVAIPIVLAIVVGCSSGGSDDTKTAASTTSAPAEKDVQVTEADFTNLADMTPVRGFFVSNVSGHLDEALKVANSPNGGDYPVGTIVQLIPTEAMVKHVKGYDPKTHDWEFFTLDASPQGTKITSHGGAEVVNAISKSSCAGCHSAAKPQFDFVCEKDHGCAPLPFTDDVIRAVQRSDPRPKGAAGATSTTAAG
jgi:hypothetical protein